MTICDGSSARPTTHDGTSRPRSSSLVSKATSRRGGILSPCSARSASRRLRSMARTLETTAGGDAESKLRTVSARASLERSDASTVRTIAALQEHTPQGYLPAAPNITQRQPPGLLRARQPRGLPGVDRLLAPDELPQF